MGSEPIKRQAALLRLAIPDFRVTLIDQLAEGDLVSSRWNASGTFSNQLPTHNGVLPPTGNSITFDIVVEVPPLLRQLNQLDFLEQMNPP